LAALSEAPQPLRFPLPAVAGEQGESTEVDVRALLRGDYDDHGARAPDPSAGGVAASDALLSASVDRLTLSQSPGAGAQRTGATSDAEAAAEVLRNIGAFAHVHPDDVAEHEAAAAAAASEPRTARSYGQPGASNNSERLGYRYAALPPPAHTAVVARAGSGTAAANLAADAHAAKQAAGAAAAQLSQFDSQSPRDFDFTDHAARSRRENVGPLAAAAARIAAEAAADAGFNAAGGDGHAAGGGGGGGGGDLFLPLDDSFFSQTGLEVGEGASTAQQQAAYRPPASVAAALRPVPALPAGGRRLVTSGSLPHGAVALGQRPVAARAAPTPAAVLQPAAAGGKAMRVYGTKNAMPGAVVARPASGAGGRALAAASSAQHQPAPRAGAGAPPSRPARLRVAAGGPAALADLLADDT
jgi:hypothetical protein